MIDMIEHILKTDIVEFGEVDEDGLKTTPDKNTSIVFEVFDGETLNVTIDGKRYGAHWKKMRKLFILALLQWDFDED